MVWIRISVLLPYSLDPLFRPVSPRVRIHFGYYEPVCRSGTVRPLLRLVNIRTRHVANQFFKYQTLPVLKVLLLASWISKRRRRRSLPISHLIVIREAGITPLCYACSTFHDDTCCSFFTLCDVKIGMLFWAYLRFLDLKTYLVIC